jgi:3-oxoadipate enol-lactonase
MKISYTVTGQVDGPWVTLSHPIGSSHSIWASLAESLGRYYRVLAYDIRGHGQSAMADGSATMDTLAADCIALWDELGIRDSAFVGLSLGGCIGMALATLAPEKVTALTIACSRLTMDEAAAKMWRDRSELVLAQGMSGIVETTLERWLSAAWRHDHPDQVLAIKNTLATTSANGFAWCAQALAQGQPLTRLAQLQMPVQFIAGLDDKAVPVDFLRAYAQQTPGSRWHELPGSHLLPVESEGLFAQAVLTFLGEVLR